MKGAPGDISPHTWRRTEENRLPPRWRPSHWGNFRSSFNFDWGSFVCTFSFINLISVTSWSHHNSVAALASAKLSCDQNSLLQGNYSSLSAFDGSIVSGTGVHSIFLGPRYGWPRNTQLRREHRFYGRNTHSNLTARADQSLANRCSEVFRDW